MMVDRSHAQPAVREVEKSRADALSTKKSRASPRGPLPVVHLDVLSNRFTWHSREKEPTRTRRAAPVRLVCSLWHYGTMETSRIGKGLKCLIGNPALIQVSIQRIAACSQGLGGPAMYMPAVFGHISVHRIITTWPGSPTTYKCRVMRDGGRGREKEEAKL